MSYYFCIVGAHDNPLYEADLSLQSNAASQGAGTSADGAASAASPPPVSQSESGRTSMFGFGSALGALAGGLGNPRALMGGSASAPGGTVSEAKSGGSSITTDDRHMLQMIAYGSLDVLEDKQFVSNAIYHKSVDRVNDWNVSAFVIPGNIKFVLLHEHKHEDGIRNFLMDVWELWVKVLSNPFQGAHEPIRTPSFDGRVRASARKHL